MDTVKQIGTTGRRHIIDRPRLTRLLDGCESGVVCLVAPAGYGKTTLARQWTSQRFAEAAWYRCTDASGDVAAIASGVASALDPAMPGVADSMESRLRRTNSPARDVLELSKLFRDAHVPATSPCLVIDDYQLLGRGPAEDFVRGLSEVPSLHLLIASRVRPVWVDTRAILYGEVVELGLDRTRDGHRRGATSSQRRRNVSHAWPSLASGRLARSHRPCGDGIPLGATR